MYHGDLALLLLIIARIHVDDLPMNFTLPAIDGLIKVRSVFIWIDIDGVFLLYILR